METDTEDAENRSLAHILALTDGIVSSYLTFALFEMLKV